VDATPPRFLHLAEAAGLSLDFPPAVLAEVEGYLARPGIDDDSLVDLTDIPFVTIDGPGTRDLDQAVHVEVHPDGYDLLYALADAAYYVAPGTALFDEALRRGASFYLPGLSVPMLPRPLSEGLISLGPDVDRRALVFDVGFDKAGSVTGYHLARARVRSRTKLSWGAVQQYLDGKGKLEAPRGQGGASRPPDPGVGPNLAGIAELGALRARHPDRAEMVRYRRIETSVRLKADGTLLVDAAPRPPIELANEQISILCNALGARYLLGGPAELVQPIYRVHEPPEPAKVAAFERLVGIVAKQRGLPDDPWLYRRAADMGLGGYLEKLPHRGPEGRVARALHRQAMLLNGRSRFDAQPLGHFGVGEQVYSRFTAPMREMVGVQCHAQAIDRMVGRSPRSRAQDEEIRARVIEAGNHAKDVQRRLDREIDALIIAAVLAPDLAVAFEERPRRTGTVVGLVSSRVHVLLDDPPLDVRVPLYEQGKQMGGAWLAVVDEGARLIRKDNAETVCRLGDEVKVRAVAPDAVVLA
jgi:ribonuclease R